LTVSENNIWWIVCGYIVAHACPLGELGELQDLVKLLPTETLGVAADNLSGAGERDVQALLEWFVRSAA
jgi:hypothetical protein